MEGFTKGGFGPPCCRGATPPSDVQCFALLCVGYEQTDKTAPEKKKDETYVWWVSELLSREGSSQRRIPGWGGGRIRRSEARKE